MTARKSSRRRIVLRFVCFLFVLGVLGCVELIRRDYYRQQRASTLRLLVKAVDRGTELGRLDKRWPRLRARMHEEMAEEPRGEMAVAAHRAAARILVEAPGAVRVDSPLDVVLHYGDEKLAKAILPDRPFRWEAEVRASWDGGEWREVDRASWTGPAPTHRVDLREAWPDVQFSPGDHLLALQAIAQLWLPGPEGEMAVALVGATDLGEHAVRIGHPRPTAGG